MSQSEEQTNERFLADVGNHKMTIENDNGVFRALLFSEPGTGNHYFYLTTWPEHLAISGDMGTYVFSRVRYMFGFFRCKDGLSINPEYWAEKLVATDKYSGHKEYSPEKFLDNVRDELTCYGEEELATLEYARFEDVANDEYSAMALANDEFNGFYEHDCTVYTYHYLWCCYAIVWGIQQYDAMRQVKLPVDK